MEMKLHPELRYILGILGPLACGMIGVVFWSLLPFLFVVAAYIYVEGKHFDRAVRFWSLCFSVSIFILSSLLAVIYIYHSPIWEDLHFGVYVDLPTDILFGAAVSHVLSSGSAPQDLSSSLVFTLPFYLVAAYFFVIRREAPFDKNTYGTFRWAYRAAGTWFAIIVVCAVLAIVGFSYALSGS